jgi:glycosyltransferase involved in cell wall biosynthesis
VKILFDFEDIVNKYWGIPLATIDDIKSIATLRTADIILWLSEKERKMIYEESFFQMNGLSELKKSVTMLDTRPINSDLWYLQFFKTFTDIETDFYYTCHFAATKIQSAQKIIRIHDPYSEFSQSWREFLSRDKIKNKIARAIRNESFKLAESKSKIVCNSNFTAERVSYIYDISIEKISVIPCGFNWKPFEDIESQRDISPLGADYYLMICGLRGSKRPDVVINAWADCDKTLPKLLVVGKIPLRSLSEVAVKQISNGRLILRDFVSESELETLKINSNAMIFASSYEGFGRPVIEALLAGVPSIANDLKVFKEISLNCVDFFSLNDPKSIEPILIKYRSKINAKESRFLVEKAKKYSHSSVGQLWKPILNLQ